MSISLLLNSVIKPIKSVFPNFISLLITVTIQPVWLNDPILVLRRIKTESDEKFLYKSHRWRKGRDLLLSHKSTVKSNENPIIFRSGTLLMLRFELILIKERLGSIPKKKERNKKKGVEQRTPETREI